MSTLTETARPEAIADLVLADRYVGPGRGVVPDERLDHLFEARCDWVTDYGRPGRLAVDSDELSLTYAELDTRANRLARYLRRHGVGAGDRIGLLLDRPIDSCIATLAVFKAGAACVPLDIGSPVERIASIVADAHPRLLLTTSAVAALQIESLTASGVRPIYLDLAAGLIDQQDPRRPVDPERAGVGDRLAYLVYTTGSDGRPVAVAIDHPTLCTFVKGAAEVYGLLPDDRVHSIAGFSVEDTWVPWACGATLVPGPAGLTGPDLQRFLRDHRVTALCCPPALLAALDDDLPDVRFVLVSGEACTPDLVACWYRPDRRILDVYRPVDATTTAAWTELHPDKPSTVGVPLPTYSTVILDVDDPSRALPHGEVGEIGLAGVGLSCGYLNRTDLDGDAFVADLVGVPANPSGRIFRTGDLGRVNTDREIEYHGRVVERTREHPAEPVPAEATSCMVPAEATSGVEDDLAEVLAGVVGVAKVPVDANFFDDLGADSMLMARFCARLRKRADLPSPSMKDIYRYPTIGSLATALAPAPSIDPVEGLLAEVLADVVGVEHVSVDSHFFDDLGADSMLMARFCARVRKRTDLPSVSIKDVYQHPTIGSLATALAPQRNPLESAFAELLTDVVGVEHVSVDSHFFDDLGADSMVMARFCARVRKRADLPSVSMKDVYGCPTIRSLATALADAAPTRVPPPVPMSPESPNPTETGPARPASSREYVLCGALQVLLFVGYAYVSALILEQAFLWISAAGADLVEIYLRSLASGAATFLIAVTLPILVKWVLVGRWTPTEIRLWTPAYIRFWFVKTLVSANPMVLFAGSPLYPLYLKALGAKIGRRVVIFSRHVPVCADLCTVGDDTVVDKDAFINCYRVVGGVIQTGRVSLGANVLVGEKAVLDIETSLGDGAQLAHASSLHAGQAVPAGERWHGSPGQPTDADYRAAGAADCGTGRRVRYGVLQLVYLLGLVLPLAFGGLTVLLVEVPWLAALMDGGPIAFTSASFYGIALLTSLALFCGSMLVSILIVTTVPRLLNLVITPDQDYPLYTYRYAFHRAISRLTNRKFFHELFGDSSYIVGYLQFIGYRLSPVVQTGSNFGTEVKHDNPYLSAIGSGTVVASGISIVNANYSSTSFRVSRTAIGSNNFLGNDIVYPPQGRTGNNCLLATKVLVPIDGEIREGVGLLGSPSFEIPRTVARDDRFVRMAHDDEFPRRLAAKNRHNLVSIGFFLLSRWCYVFAIVLAGFSAADLYYSLGPWALTLANVFLLGFTIVYFALVERASTGFRGVRPKHCSIYDIDFWRTERFFKLCARANVHRLLNGTPFKAAAWRLLGVRVGRRLFDDGAGMSEKNIVTIGDDVTLNAGSYIQCHSQEDYAFKSDATTVGSGCTIGVAAMVHYGVTMGDGSVLAPDSFLMKGEEVPPHERWGGNPAREMPAVDPFAPRVDHVVTSGGAR